MRIRQTLQELRQTVKDSGVRGALKRYGWKLVAGLFCYYLVRDLTLYVLIPYYVARRFLATP